MGFFDRAWNLGKGLAKVHGAGSPEEREEARLRALALEEELRRAGVDRAALAERREDRAGSAGRAAEGRAAEGQPAADHPWERPEQRPPAKRTL